MLEIKCPITCQDKRIIDSVTNIPNVNYLKLINGEITIKKSLSYYSQCQILMYVTRLDECDLFVYNLLSPVLLTITKDENYLLNTLPKVENFYFSYFLPASFLNKSKNQNSGAV